MKEQFIPTEMIQIQACSLFNKYAKRVQLRFGMFMATHAVLKKINRNDVIESNKSDIWGNIVSTRFENTNFTGIPTGPEKVEK